MCWTKLFLKWESLFTWQRTCVRGQSWPHKVRRPPRLQHSEPSVPYLLLLLLLLQHQLLVLHTCTLQHASVWHAEQIRHAELHLHTVNQLIQTTDLWRPTTEATWRHEDRTSDWGDDVQDFRMTFISTTPLDMCNKRPLFETAVQCEREPAGHECETRTAVWESLSTFVPFLPDNICHRCRKRSSETMKSNSSACREVRHHSLSLKVHCWQW